MADDDVAGGIIVNDEYLLSANDEGDENVGQYLSIYAVTVVGIVPMSTWVSTWTDMTPILSP